MRLFVTGTSKAVIACLLTFTINARATELDSVPGEYVVKLKDSFSVDNPIEALSEKLGSYVKTTIPGQNIVVIKRPVFEISTSVINALAQNPLVDIIEPNFIYRINKIPTDPLFNLLWGLKNTGQEDNDHRIGLEGIDIDAERAWDITTGSKDVTVAVIDTGIAYNHPDLKGNVWTNRTELLGKPRVDDDHNGIVDDIYGANFVDSKKPTGNPMDDNGHGTHTSGTIGASANNGTGIAGVAWNVRLMSCKFLSSDGSGSLDGALKCIDYAISKGVKIMSNSWGADAYSETLKKAIQRANAAGALFVVSAGNDSTDNDSTPRYPSSYNIPNILSVAAIDNRGRLASFSNWGRNKVHVAAPGVRILSSIPRNAYAFYSGTSMAAPHASGLAVLLAANEPKLTNIEMKNRIISTSRLLAGLRGKIKGGLVNGYSMLTNTIPPPDADDPANWRSVDVRISSAHPYRNKTEETFEVRVPGAKQISLYFTKFDTEKSYDIVALYDSLGKQVATMSGKNNGLYSPVIDGDYVRIIFTSDTETNGYGFDIRKAAWR